MPSNISHQGSCHCGRVSFQIQASKIIEAISCNCSICKSTGFLHLIVNADDFELLQGQDSLTEYQFNTNTARHLFCKYCGVKSFYIPRSHPSSYSVNVNCLKRDSIELIKIKDFDGQNWEESVEDIIN